jgi:CRP-like cAMP-binding protein
MVANPPSSMIENRILAALPGNEYQRLAPHLEEVPLTLGDVLYWPGDQVKFVYFPQTAVVSLIAAMKDGVTVEAGLTGREGMVGVSALLGAETTPHEMIVQHEGRALRMKAERLCEHTKEGGVLHDRLLRYMHLLFTQVTQTAACNRLHTLNQRLARWLLMINERVCSPEFKLTQEFISRMLGVRRAGVSVAANTLQQRGLINYSRGSIRILNRAALKAESCECYRIVKAELDDFLKG